MSRRSVFQMFFECGSMYSRHSGRTKLDCSICSKDSCDSSLGFIRFIFSRCITTYRGVGRLKWFDPYLESLTPSLSYHTCVILTCVYESRSMTKHEERKRWVFVLNTNLLIIFVHYYSSSYIHVRCCNTYGLISSRTAYKCTGTKILWFFRIFN